jgi:hypothetical protein
MSKWIKWKKNWWKLYDLIEIKKHLKVSISRNNYNIEIYDNVN